MAARRIEIQFLGRDVSAGKTAAQVEGRFGKFQSKMQGFGDRAGKFIAGGLVVAGAAMVKFGQQASDLAETQSKVQQIFGKEGAAALQQFASSAAKNMGMSKQAALDAVSTFGMFGKMAGLSGRDLDGFSTHLTSLASDMASFSNTTPEEAIEAIGSALRGEAEPIRKYGVLLDDATLRNEAMRMGLIKTTKEALTPQQKVLAAQSAILRQTSDQQGDFARTSDGLANKQRIMKAQFENLTTTLGAKALPVMLKVTDWAVKAIDWMGKHKDLLKNLAMVIGPLVAGLYAMSVAQRVLNLVMKANPIILIITTLISLGVALVALYKKSETFRKIVDGAFKVIASSAKWMWEKVLRPTFFFLVKTFVWVADKILSAAAWAFGWVPGLGPKLKEAAAKMKVFKENVNAYINGIENPHIKVKTSGDQKALDSLRAINREIRRIISAAPFIDLNPGQRSGHPTRNRARGGPVTAGRAYVVGETQPELFVPNRNGRIVPKVPAEAKAGGGDTYIIVNGALDPQAVAKQIQGILLKHKRRNGGALGLA